MIFTIMEMMNYVCFITCTYHHTATVGQYQGTLMSWHSDTVNIIWYIVIASINIKYVKLLQLTVSRFLRSRQYQKKIS